MSQIDPLPFLLMVNFSDIFRFTSCRHGASIFFIRKCHSGVFFTSVPFKGITFFYGIIIMLFTRAFLKQYSMVSILEVSILLRTFFHSIVPFFGFSLIQSAIYDIAPSCKQPCNATLNFYS